VEQRGISQDVQEYASENDFKSKSGKKKFQKFG
jgi:hypothetical protein